MKLRAAISLLLFTAMIYLTSGYFVVFKLQQFHIKREVKQRLKAGVPESRLTLVKIPVEWEKSGSSQFQRIHAGEFRYHGEMYDIVRSEAKGDTTFYYCIHDKEETKLFANLDKLIQTDSAPNPERQKRLGELLKLLSQQYLAPGNNTNKLVYTNMQYKSSYCFGLQTWSVEPPYPPPKQS